MKRSNVITALVAVAVVVAGVFIARGMRSGTSESAQQATRKKAPQVRVVSAPRGAISLTLDLTGTVEPYRVAMLASPAEGPILDIRAREGDRVRKGQVLLAVGRKQGVDALIVSLREETDKEEDNLERTRRLVESDALPGEELDRARASYEKVRAQLVKAEETAGDYTVTAPWAGVISRVLVRDGEFVSPRTALIEVYDPSSLVIRASVPEKHASEIAAGMRVEATLDAIPGVTMSCRIDRIYPYLDQRLRNRIVEIVPDNGAVLLPGMFARLKVGMKAADEAVILPADALVSTPKGRIVFVVRNGKAVMKPVETGIEDGSRVEMTAGVAEGDSVVVAGGEKLKDGVAVSVAGQGEAGKGKPKDRDGSPPGGKGEAEGGKR
jgi:membrane fusion protein (multidrug efflux system)